jgi:diguanylate cyclase (GGDEF)-like protein
MAESPEPGPAAEQAPVLVPLRQEMVDAGHSQLVAANEQLVLAMMRAQTDAETAARTLDEVSRHLEHDALTDLPNRMLLLDRLARAIASAKRHGVRLALLFLDLNNFKQINDTLGHAVGDEVLKLAARRLTSSVRASDTVSRHGGDEFLILVAEVSHAADALLIADKILSALGAPCCVGDHELRLTASIGISIYPDDGEDAAMLIDRADSAMYCAKRHGLGSVAFRAETPTSERVESPPLKSRHQPMSYYEHALALHERRYAQLREANEGLVLAALNAQELLAEERARAR